MHVFTVSRAIELRHGDAELVEACQQSPACNISGRQRNVTSHHYQCSRLSFWGHCHGAHSFHRLPLLGGAKDEGPLVLVPVSSGHDFRKFGTRSLDVSLCHAKPSVHSCLCSTVLNQTALFAIIPWGFDYSFDYSESETVMTTPCLNLLCCLSRIRSLKEPSCDILVPSCSK